MGEAPASAEVPEAQPGERVAAEPAAEHARLDAVYRLPPDHPGAGDLGYRQRRRAIATALVGYRAGEPIPLVEYTAEEDAVWATVSRELAVKHERLACRQYLEAAARLPLGRGRVPQLRDVDASLAAASRFHLRPVAGLVPASEFYAALASRTFLSTQYIRHHSEPRYTPEPDIVHEIIGHARALAGDEFAALYEAAGRASLRATTAESADFFSRVFWFSLEFGVVYENGEAKAVGAGLLSSFGEIDAFRRAEIRPFNLALMGTQPYDITRYQDVLFAAPSFGAMLEELIDFFDSFDNDVARRLAGSQRLSA